VYIDNTFTENKLHAKKPTHCIQQTVIVLNTTLNMHVNTYNNATTPQKNHKRTLVTQAIDIQIILEVSC